MQDSTPPRRWRGPDRPLGGQAQAGFGCVLVTRTGSALAASAWAGVMYRSEIIEASTSLRRCSAASGSTVGSYSDGAWVTPARSAYWPRVRPGSGALKYAQAAALTPRRPSPVVISLK